MAGQGSGGSPEGLLAYLGASNIPEAVAALASMDFETMQSVLDTFLVGSGGGGEQ